MKTKTYLLVFFLLCCTWRSAANPETIRGGSYIINMGVTPQTIANGLKPYGLVYDLLKNYKVPVKWIINSSKSKDGIDFTYNGINYYGGTFIILAEYRTTTINSVISSWQSQGVIGTTTTSAFTVDVSFTLHHTPIWTLDKTNGAIAVDFFANAGIPSTAYGGSSSSGWKTPAQLSACDDIFVMPHADPTWNTHNNLYYWNLNFKGNIWAGCHAVSVLENISDPANTVQLNFLSSTGLIPYGSHADGSAPYSYNFSGDAVMQFMQSMDNATNNGSERIFIPKAGGWRPTTKIGVYDNTQADVPSASPGPAAVLAYGRGYGDNARGWVMYEAGHDINSGGTVAERVAAQRAFFNFSFYSTGEKNAGVDIKLENIPELMVANHSYPMSFSVPSGVDLNNYRIKWTSSCAGTFSSDNQQSVIFTPTAAYTNCIITVTLLDACNRELFDSKGFYSNGSLLPVGTVLVGSYDEVLKSVNLNWISPDNQLVQYFEIEKSGNGNQFSPMKKVFTSQDSLTASYNLIDHNPLNGPAYYRLKIVNRNGSIKYSNVVKIERDISFSLMQVFPNPVKDAMSVKYSTEKDQLISLKLVDMNGGVVLKRNEKAGKGINTSLISLSHDLPPGTYFLMMSLEEKNLVEKITVLK